MIKINEDISKKESIYYCPELMLIEVLATENDIWLRAADKLVQLSDDGDVDKLVAMLIAAKAKKVQYNMSSDKKIKPSKKETGAFYQKGVKPRFDNDEEGEG